MSKETYAKLVIYHLTNAAQPANTLQGLRHLSAAMGILAGYAQRMDNKEVLKVLASWRKILDEITDMHVWLSLDEGHWWRESSWDEDFIEEHDTEELRTRNFYTIQRNYTRILQVAHWAMATLGLGEAVDIPDISEFINSEIPNLEED
jgi:hypothetical protein